MGRMFGDKLVKEERMVVRVSDNGIVLSDLHLAGMILACVEGTACYKTLPRDGSSTRFLFHIEGDKEKIEQFVDYWFSGNKKAINELMQKRAEELRKYGNIISMLKALLDKSRADKTKNVGTVQTQKGQEATADGVNKNKSGKN